jgi:signal transduction histidine kinase
MHARLNYSALVIAAIGFFLTRFTVTLAVDQSPLRFYLTGVVPLVLGLGLAAFGVALLVADVEATLVRTTALWCGVGTGAMLVLVSLTLMGSSTGGMPEFATVRSRAYFSNFLIGGSVGGTLTGLYAARNRRQRESLHRQADRLEVLNRLLRHEVINSVNVIRGYVSTPGADDRADAIIDDHADAIAETVEEVKHLTRSAGTGQTTTRPTDIGARLDAAVEAVNQRHAGADVDRPTYPEDTTVLADERLERVFTELLENAVGHADADPRVDVSTTPTAVRVHVRDGGPGLPESQRTLLETGSIEEFDDPTTGFGLNVVRLLVESYSGSIETEVGPGGTEITVALPRAAVGTAAVRPSEGLAGVRPATPQLAVTLGAALVAGVLFGVVAEWLGASVGFIGVYYGVSHAVVGWFTHEFHSVVFGFAFAGLISLAPARYRGRLPAHAAIGAAWGVALWVFAAGVVSPIWLRLLDVPASIPSLSPWSLVSHLVWGVTLGALTAVGYGYVRRRGQRPGR